MLENFIVRLRFLNQRYFFDYFLVIVMALGLFAWLQASPTLPEPDSFYHAKMAQLISRGEILHQFPWLAATALKDDFTDHHFLYHLLLAPFIWLPQPLIGLKLATVIFAALLVAVIYWLFKKFQIKWPFIFIIFLLTSEPWLFRASLVKAPAVFLAFFVVAFYALSHQKKFLLFLLSFGAAWLYAGWPLFLLLGILYLFVNYAVGKLRRRQSLFLKLKDFLLLSENGLNLKGPLRGLVVIVSGLAAGLLINPYFPNNLVFFWQQFVKIAVINFQSVIGVGGEWYPYGFIQLLADAPLAASLLLASLFVFAATFRKQSIYSWLWGIFSLLFFLLTLKSRRYVELYLPFTVIFAAFAWSDVWRQGGVALLWRALGRLWRFIFLVLLSLAAVGFLINIPRDVVKVKNDIKHGLSLEHYHQVSDWVKVNTTPGTTIINADWDDFPALFYYNEQNFYLTGLDPTFMYQFDPRLYQQYVQLTLGRPLSDPGYVLANQLKTSYILLDNQHQSLERLLSARADFRLIYADDEARVFIFNDLK